MHRFWSLHALLCLSLVGCGGGAEQAGTTTPRAGTTGEPACERFATALCGKLGARSEPCAALRSVSEWLTPKACDAALEGLDAALERIVAARKDCEELSRRVCGDIGQSTRTCAELRRDLPEVAPAQCRALLAHYDELLQQLRGREARLAPVPAADWSELLAAGAPAFGPESARVTIVEFSDFECPYCSQAARTVQQIRERYGDRVRLVFRQFPLSFHEHARGAALAALAAHAQGKFWAFHDLLFEHQSALDRGSLDSYAAQVGLDVAAFKKHLEQAAGASQLDQDLALGRKVHVDGTPTMFLNGARVENPTDFEVVAPLIDAALSPAAGEPVPVEH